MEKLAKMAKMAKILNSILKVLRILLLIGAAIIIAVVSMCTIVFLVKPELMSDMNLTKLILNSLTFELSQGFTIDGGAALAHLWTMAILAALNAVLLYAGLGYVREMLQPIADRRPFDCSVGQNIRKISFIWLAMGIAQSVGSAISGMAVARIIDHAELMGGTAIGSVAVNYDLDLGFLLVFFFLLMLSYIFNYGAELQQLSDETL